MVVREVENKRSENYDYTAEQIVSKIRRDSSADAIIPHSVKAAKPIELSVSWRKYCYSNTGATLQATMHPHMYRAP